MAQLFNVLKSLTFFVGAVAALSGCFFDSGAQGGQADAAENSPGDGGDFEGDSGAGQHKTHRDSGLGKVTLADGGDSDSGDPGARDGAAASDAGDVALLDGAAPDGSGDAQDGADGSADAAQPFQDSGSAGAPAPDAQVELGLTCDSCESEDDCERGYGCYASASLGHSVCLAHPASGQSCSDIDDRLHEGQTSDGESWCYPYLVGSGTSLKQGCEGW